MTSTRDDEARLFEAVRQATAGKFDLLTTLGGSRDAAGFLARSVDDCALAVILVQPAPAGSGAGRLRWRAVRELDAALSLGTLTCPACHESGAGWAPRCVGCGHDLRGGVAPGGVSPEVVSVLETAVWKAYGGRYMLLGEVPRAEGAGTVLFAHDAATGDTRGFLLERASGGGAGNGLSLVPWWGAGRVPVEFFGGRIFSDGPLEVVPETPEPGRAEAIAAAPAHGRWVLSITVLALCLTAAALVAVRRLGSGEGSSEERVALAPRDTPRQAGVADSAFPSDLGTAASGDSESVVDPVVPPQVPPAHTSDNGSRQVASLDSPGGTGASGKQTYVENPVERPPPPPLPPPPPPPVSDERAVLGTVEGYVAAVASRDIARVHRAYPGITTREVAGWEDLFDRVAGPGGLQVRHAIEWGPEIRGSTAEVVLVLTLRYTDREGVRHERPLALRAVLERVGSGWRLDQVLTLE